MTFFNSVKIHLAKFDYMSNGPNLKVEGKRSYQTAIGGIINIILIILSFIGICYFGLQMLNKTEPIVVESSMEGHQVGPYSVGEGGFNLFIGIEFPNWTYYMNDRIYTVNATIGINEFDDQFGQSYSLNVLDFGPCSNYYNQESLNVEINIANFWCFAPNNSAIEGYWGAEKSSTITFSLHKCENKTSNNNHCFPENEINLLMQSGMISMFATNSFLNLNNYHRPVEFKLQNWYNSINIDFTYDYFYVLKELEFHDDNGFLLPTDIQTSNFYFETPFILYFGKRGSLLATINIQGDKFGTRIKRSYSKIQDVLTKIGGLLKALSIIAALISNTVSEIEFYSDFIFSFKHQLRNCEYLEKNQFDLKTQKLNLSSNNNDANIKDSVNLTSKVGNYILC